MTAVVRSYIGIDPQTFRIASVFGSSKDKASDFGLVGVVELVADDATAVKAEIAKLKAKAQAMGRLKR